MCGIYGYTGAKNASEVIADGLKRLDYRGYDSWGIAVITNSNLDSVKDVGVIDLEKAKKLAQSTIGIGHTRWATHGAVTVENAHPHFSTNKSFALAQNGIVENFEELKKNLIHKGYTFISQTDTEVIVRLIEEELKTETVILKAIQNSFKKLEGRNTIIVITKEGEIIAARNGSPLVIGKNSKNEIYVSSDVLSFAPYVEDIFVMENMQMIQIKDKTISAFDLKKMESFEPQFQKLDIVGSDVDKAGFEHYMLKEIHETPDAIAAILNGNPEQYKKLAEKLTKAKTVYTIGSGSAGIAAAQIAFYLRAHAHIPTVHLVGADAAEYTELFTNNDVIIAPSQSGETADVLEVLEIAKKKGVCIVTYVNMPGSMMTRMADFAFLANSGPEICVMSTKVFTSQMTWGYYIAKPETDLKQLETTMRHYLDDKTNHEKLQKLATQLADKDDIFLLGKHQNYAVIMEGMVKLIEGTYKHAHALPAGDLKHYAITLMEKGVPVIAVYSEDNLIHDVENAVSQVQARGATVIGIGPTKLNHLDEYIPVPNVGDAQAIMNIIPLQLLAYYLAKQLGNSIDKPRHIAKSVTVK